MREQISWAHRVNNKKYFLESRAKETSFLQQNEGRLSRYVKYCVGNSF
jgi:hypothetical protein